jgi:Zn-dependent protease
VEWLLQAPILLFSLIWHEYSHGWMAFRRGDDTAAMSGRLSFDPLDHIDPIGTIAVPVLCVMKGLPMFGWAKPTPVNTARLRDPRWDSLRVAFAGPASNLVLATLTAVGLRALTFARPSGAGLAGPLFLSFVFALQINLLLAFFNLIPVFPLDGSKVVAALLPYRWLRVYEEHTPYGGIIVLLLVVTNLASLFIVPGMTLMMRAYHAVGLL